MKENVEIQYEKHELENYVMDMLTLETCKLFLPAAFIRTGEGITASYHAEGYRRLSCLKELATEDVFSVALSLVEGAADAERHYIFTHEYEITTESVFADGQCSKAKLLFLPAKADTPLADKIAALLEGLGQLAPEEGRGYIDDAVSFIRQDAFGYKAVMRHLEKLRKEVYLCGVS